MEENFSTNLHNDSGNIYFRSSCVIMIGNSDGGGNNKNMNSESQELPVDKIHSFSEKCKLSTNDKPCVEIQPIKNDLWSGSETVENLPHLTLEIKPDQSVVDQSAFVQNRLHVTKNVLVDRNSEFSTDCNQNELNLQSCSSVVVKTRTLEVGDSEIINRADGQHFEVLSSIGVRQEDEILPVVPEISSDLDQQDINSGFYCDLDNVNDYRKLISDRCEKLTPKHKDVTNFPKVKNSSNSSTDSLISKKYRKFEHLEDELTDLCTCPHQDRYTFSLKVGEELKKYFELI